MSLQRSSRILVIDDENRLRQVCRRVLEPEGLELVEAADGISGLEAIEEKRPDLVLVDLMMPRMDGMEVLAKAREKHPDLAFVVITGFATLEKAVQAMKQGADDFLAKPFKPQELRMVVQRVLRRVRTLQDMSFEKSRSRLLISSMSNGVLVADMDGTVALMNPALRELLGDKDMDHRGKPLEQAMPCPKVVEVLTRILAEGPQGEKGSVTCQIALDGPGQPQYLQVTCLPFLGGMDKMVGAMAIFENVTAWRRLDDLKNEYVSTVAHDIASPLGSVISQLDTLERGLAGELNEKQAHLIRRAKLRVQGIVDLSRDLLDLAKMDNSAAEKPEPLALGTVLAEAVEVQTPAAQAKGQALSLELPDGLPKVKAAPLALGQVFGNLISNAVRYTPEGGEIKVRAGGGADGLWVEVADNGLGIDPEEFERIFERFYRVKNADTRTIVGTGLGLPIVKKVVESLGGRIEIESAPGQGSTFTVRLPAA